MYLRKYVQRVLSLRLCVFVLAGAVVSVPWPCASRGHRVILSDTSSFSRRLSFNPRAPGLVFVPGVASNIAVAPSYCQPPQSGTGKTAVFSMGILQMLDTTSSDTQALVLSPTRELAEQTQKVRVLRACDAMLPSIKSIDEPKARVSLPRSSVASAAFLAGVCGGSASYDERSWLFCGSAACAVCVLGNGRKVQPTCGEFTGSFVGCWMINNNPVFGAHAVFNTQVILALGDFMNVQCHACIGGKSIGEDIRRLDYGVQVC